MQVPDGWKESQLGKVITHTKGYAFSSSDYSDAGIRIIRITDTTEFGIKNENSVFLPKEKLIGLEKYILKSNDIIINTVGSRPHLRSSMVGKVIRIRMQNSGSLLNQNMVKVTANEYIKSNFLYLSISNDVFLDFITSIVRGNANQVSITLSDLFKFPILLPPLPEQQKIAEILSTWDGAITATQALIDTARLQKKALMQQLLTGKKRLKGFDGEWRNVALYKIADVIMGSSPKSEAYNDAKEGLPLLQGNADIKNRLSMPRIYTSQITKECIVDDVLLSVRAPVGEISRSIHHACIGRGIAAVRSKKSTSQNYIYQWLLYFEPKWIRLSQGSTFESVNSNDIKSLYIHIPPYLPEQIAIAAILSDADREIELLTQKLTHLKTEKSALMQQLLTGKRRVKIINKEIAV